MVIGQHGHSPLEGVVRWANFICQLLYDTFLIYIWLYVVFRNNMQPNCSQREVKGQVLLSTFNFRPSLQRVSRCRYRVINTRLFAVVIIQSVKRHSSRVKYMCSICLLQTTNLPRVVSIDFHVVTYCLCYFTHLFKPLFVLLPRNYFTLKWLV